MKITDKMAYNRNFVLFKIWFTSRQIILAMIYMCHVGRWKK